MADVGQDASLDTREACPNCEAAAATIVELRKQIAGLESKLAAATVVDAPLSTPTLLCVLVILALVPVAVYGLAGRLSGDERFEWTRALLMLSPFVAGFWMSATHLPRTARAVRAGARGAIVGFVAISIIAAIDLRSVSATWEEVARNIAQFTLVAASSAIAGMVVRGVLNQRPSGSSPAGTLAQSAVLASASLEPFARLGDQLGSVGKLLSAFGGAFTFLELAGHAFGLLGK